MAFEFTRRQVMIATASAALGSVAYREAWATPDEVAAEIKKITEGRPVADGRIKLDLPSIAENGQVVPLGFEIESPMTEADYVRSLHIFGDGNPNPQVATFHFTPSLPKASGQIRMRLAQTQNVIAIAVMSNGALFTARKEVKVTIGGCGG